MPKNTEQKYTSNVTSTGSSSYRVQEQTYSSFSSQTSVQRVVTKTSSTPSFPSTLSVTNRTTNLLPPSYQFPSLTSSLGRASLNPPQSSGNNKPKLRSIFDIDDRPLTSPKSDAVGYQSPFQRKIQPFSSALSISPSPVAPSTGNTTPQNFDPRIPTYNTNGRKRGKALIINNIKFMRKEEERKGAEADERRISELFRKMGFEIKVYRNLKKSEMIDKVVKFKSDKSLEKVDISLVVMMSHGNNTKNYQTVPGGFTQIIGTDGENLPIDDVLNKFDTANCLALKGKPKIFIFQCCRGEQEEKLHVDAAPNKKLVKQHADMLIAFSTLPGFSSLRHEVRGSWYIESICEVFEKHAKEFDVETMLKIVDERLSKKHPEYQQTSTYESRGFKRCYLNPV